MSAHGSHTKPKWPLLVGIFVWAGIVATVGLAIVESWWG
jgi:hypothetical protein